MTQNFTILGRLPGYNEFAKGDWHKYVTYIPTTPTVDRENPRLEGYLAEDAGAWG